jgi:hypothetical protein
MYIQKLKNKMLFSTASITVTYAISYFLSKCNSQYGKGFTTFTQKFNLDTGTIKQKKSYIFLA